MKKYASTIMMLAVMAFAFNAHAASGQAIKVEYGSTSMTLELNENPKIVNGGSNIVLKTYSTSVTISLPCKVTIVDGSSTDIKDLVNIKNNSDDEPLNVFSMDGRKIAVLENTSQLLSLKHGIYIVNGKKIIIK
jgi:hypothetical protein